MKKCAMCEREFDETFYRDVDDGNILCKDCFNSLSFENSKIYDKAFKDGINFHKTHKMKPRIGFSVFVPALVVNTDDETSEVMIVTSRSEESGKTYDPKTITVSNDVIIGGVKK